MVVRSLAVIVIVLITALGSAADAETANIVAVHATGEKDETKSFDIIAGQHRSRLERLPYSKFETVENKEVRLKVDGLTRIEINDRYTLYIIATDVSRDGLVLATLRVMGSPKDSRATVKVVEMRARLAHGKPVAIYGLRMEEGELAIFVTLR